MRRFVTSVSRRRTALTREGQIKHNKTRHEKDDRNRVDDRRHWVLGFDNREKLSVFERQAQQLAERIGELDRKINPWLRKIKTKLFERCNARC